MLNNNDGNFYAFINEQMQIKNNNQTLKKSNKLNEIENSLLKMVDSLKIVNYNPNEQIEK